MSATQQKSQDTGCMKVKRNEPEAGPKQRKIGDLFSMSRLNYAMYIMIAILLTMIVYFVIAEYLMYQDQLTAGNLDVRIAKNGVEGFADGPHPVIVVEASTRKPSAIDVMLISTVYSTQQSSGDYISNYTSFFILPKNAFSTDFNLTVTASDEKGGLLSEKITIRTPAEPEVVFNVR